MTRRVLALALSTGALAVPLSPAGAFAQTPVVVSPPLASATPAAARTTAPATVYAPSISAATETAPPVVTAPVPVVPKPGVIARWARVSFFAQGASSSSDGEAAPAFSEVVTTLAAESVHRQDGGFQYGVNLRFGTYPSSEDRSQRVSIYDAYVAQGFSDGRMFVKGGQMWLNDLGGLGAVAGGLFEMRQSWRTKGLRWRAGGFGGVEPKILEAGYVPGITKYGGYFALDGDGARKHVVGYVGVRNQNLTERSVLTFTNYVPAGKSFFLYQAAEVDLAGPGGQGTGHLTYFFVNAHGAPSHTVDVQVTYHRGVSIDARSITDDIINGRPVPAKSLDGFLFQSYGARVTVRVTKTLRVYGGFGQDTNDRATDPTGRLTLGATASNLFGTGIDVTVSDYRYSAGSSSSYDSWYVSAGRSLGSRVYLSGEYNSSMSVLRLTQADGVVIENRPQTKRLGGSAVINLTRTVGLLVNADYTMDGSYREMRLLSGLTYRF
jgi:hypothetical protein